jgi:3-(3-hydroxy-phenyl)propionate hydroxylase
VLLAGDAAHVHSPIGGQGLNIGVQDAVNLGRTLARVVNGTSPETLLDTYHAERYPVGARGLQKTMAQTALTRSNPRTDALRETIAEPLSMPSLASDSPGCSPVWTSSTTSVRASRCSGVGCPISTWSPPTAPLRVFTLLHDARPALLDLGESGGFDITPWAGRVQVVDADYAGEWEPPVIGAVTAPACGADPTRRVRGLGGRPHPPGAP